MSTSTQSPRRETTVPARPLPEMRVTRYDRVSSAMMSLVLALILGVIGVVAWWLTTRPPPPIDLVPLELVEMPGGYEDGDDLPPLESPEAEVVPEPQVEQALDSVIELADQSTQQLEQVLTEDVFNNPRPGTASGTGRGPLGTGGGTGGIAREQRWFVRFDDAGSLEEYAKQLDFFGIELGCLLPGGELVFLSKLSQAQPAKRSVRTGKGEQRLYMTWQGGERRSADEKLFQKAGVSVGSGTIFHFYPPQTEQLLARLELSFANRAAKDIRRTYFVVVSQRNGYTFAVTRQTYLR